jgi:hypothetical protein
LLEDRVVLGVEDLAVVRIGLRWVEPVAEFARRFDAKLVLLSALRTSRRHGHE